VEEPSEVQSVVPPVATNVQHRLSIWQKLKDISFKRLFLICVGVGTGLGIGVVATVASVVWLTSRPIPVRDWPRLEVEGAGLRAKLKTDWNDSVRYQLVVTPRSDDLKAAFAEAVQSNRDSISFTLHLYDKAGFELCKKDVKPTPFVDAENRIDGLHSYDTFYSFECSRSNYKESDHWNLSYVFPALTAAVPTGSTATTDLKWYKKRAPDGAWYKTQAVSAQEAKDKLAKAMGDAAEPRAPKENVPPEEDDTLTGFDYLNGHLETLSGNTFLVRAGEQDVANTWNIKVQVEGGKQPRLHIACKTKGDCVIENTTNSQAVHGKRIR
jgi:hypothetical protein